MNIKMKCLFVVILALFFFVIGVYVGKGDLSFKKDTMYKGVVSEQQACEHEWKVIEESNSIINIYCPKCKAEQIIDKKEWNKKIIDREYKKTQEHYSDNKRPVEIK